MLDGGPGTDTLIGDAGDDTRVDGEVIEDDCGAGAVSLAEERPIISDRGHGLPT